MLFAFTLHAFSVCLFIRCGIAFCFKRSAFRIEGFNRFNRISSKLFFALEIAAHLFRTAGQFIGAGFRACFIGIERFARQDETLKRGSGFGFCFAQTRHCGRGDRLVFCRFSLTQTSACQRIARFFNFHFGVGDVKTRIAQTAQRENGFGTADIR